MMQFILIFIFIFLIILFTWKFFTTEKVLYLRIEIGNGYLYAQYSYGYFKHYKYIKYYSDDNKTKYKFNVYNGNNKDRIELDKFLIKTKFDSIEKIKEFQKKNKVIKYIQLLP